MTTTISKAAAEYKRKSAIALGIALIAVLFLIETTVAHRTVPSPASPFVWSVLVLVGGVALACAWWYRRKAASAR